MTIPEALKVLHEAVAREGFSFSLEVKEDRMILTFFKYKGM